nr:biotin/lipoyl-binding protein [uncultured Anaerobutyricum sp.]
MDDNKKNGVTGNRKKKRKIKVTITVVLVIVVVAGAVFSFRNKGRKAQTSGNKIMESKVQTGNLSQTVEGTGTLTNADSSDLKIPVGIKIKKVKVSEGDEVKKGDTLATVDKTSLQAALAQTQEELDNINKQLGDEADSDTSKYIEASVGGRVKKIYASKNTEVANTVLEQGALMLLSLDGKMVVKIETSVNLTVGQNVKVVLSSGSSVTGTVTKSEDESCTITVTDKGTKYNDKVTAYTSLGTKIGTGKLRINKEVKVTATSGTVSSILVSENEYVSEGDQLIKLKGDFQSEEYLTLESEKEDLEEKLASLLKIAKNNTITADEAGIITAVSISEDAESGSSSDSSSSSGSTSSSTGSSATGSSGNSGVAAGTSVTESSKMTVSTLKNTTNTVKAVNLSTNHKTISAAETPSVSLCTVSTTENVSTENIDSYNAEKTENSSETTTETTTETNTETNTEIKTETKNEVSTGTTKQKSETAESNNSSSSTQTKKSQSANSSENDQKSLSNTDKTKNTTQNENQVSGKNSVNSSGKSETVSNTSTSTSSDTETEINTEFTSAFNIASGDEMMLSVNVDEMDISSIETGQKATITFDAIEDKEYEGEITNIDKNGTTSSGTTKYPVEITVTKEDAMMAGMNASVTITTSEVSDALLIPAIAVAEEGNTSYVYTKKDDKTGKLSGKTEVQTGDTDGNNIVITNGLSAGDTVYYSMAASSSSNDNSANDADSKNKQDMNKQDMKMNRNFGGGNLPSGGGPGGSN